MIIPNSDQDQAVDASCILSTPDPKPVSDLPVQHDMSSCIPSRVTVSDLNRDPDVGYSDAMLHHVGHELNSKWKMLGVYLGIPYSELCKMIDVKTPHEMAVEMFYAWWDITDVHIRWGDLHHALAGAKRMDLVVETQDYFRQCDLDYNDPNPSDIQLYFARFAQKIPADWQEVGARLGIDRHVLDSIGREPENDVSQHGYKVLKMWQALPDSTHHHLLSVVMDDMNRPDLMRYLLQTFAKEAENKVKGGCDETCEH